MDDSKSSVGGYVVGALLILGGVVWFVFGLFGDISSITDGMVPLEGPGVFDVELQERGTWTVFHEHRTVIDGKSLSSEPYPDGLEFRLESAEGQGVNVRAASSNGTYSFGSREGSSMFEFDVHTPGAYVVSVLVEGERAERPVVMTMSRDFMGGIWAAILGGFARMGGGFLVGILVIVWTALANDRRKKRG
jgi:hypothetical protein